MYKIHISNWTKHAQNDTIFSEEPYIIVHSYTKMNSHQKEVQKYVC